MKSTINIDQMDLNISLLPGQQQRVEQITQSAFAELTEMLERSHLHSFTEDQGVITIGELSIPDISVSLNQVTDEEVARLIAEAIYEELLRYMSLLNA